MDPKLFKILLLKLFIHYIKVACISLIYVSDMLFYKLWDCIVLYNIFAAVILSIPVSTHIFLYILVNNLTNSKLSSH